jgi:adenylate cyclase
LLDVDRLAPLQPAQETLELLSDWSTLMLAAIEGHGGRVTQHAGDSICAVFGAPDHEPGAGATMAAAQTALETMALLAQFNTERCASGKVAIESRVGLASGEVVTGACGTPRRAAYVCVGATVARAARLAALAAQAGCPVLIDGVTRAALSGRIGTEAVQTAALPDRPTDGPTDGPTYALKAG